MNLKKTQENFRLAGKALLHRSKGFKASIGLLLLLALGSGTGFAEDAAQLALATRPRAVTDAPEFPAMHWADSSRGRPFTKDPAVVRFKDRYLMFYSMPPFTNGLNGDGWAIGIAESADLTGWKKVGELLPMQDCDRKGLCAPGAWVHEGRLHLFYQTYGNGAKDAICHAWSDDGVTFTRDASNPIFAPHGSWTVGRAIDAEVFPMGDRLLLFFATREPKMQVQMVGVAGAPLESDYSRANWKLLVDGPVLKPELPWERRCIEAPTVVRRGDTLWMFYAGGYNNEPQQIGVAMSRDGLKWTRFSNQPLIANGAPGDWNACESGHPGAFVDRDDRTYLFYQGNRDNGRSWYLSRVEITWPNGRPVVKP
ncbi:MAG: family 43 glycosylhydrolase [Verrucomicrobiota bacterium]